MINEHDITKSMLGRIRTIINENVEAPMQQGVEAQPTEEPQQTEQIKDIQVLKDGNVVSDKPGMAAYWDGEKDKFMQTVTPDVNFADFIISPKTTSYEGNVLLSGRLNKFDVEFKMNKDESVGLTVTMNDKILNDDLMTLLGKLKGYYTGWQKDWSEKLNSNEFKNL
jgi:hypothetical protein